MRPSCRPGRLQKTAGQTAQRHGTGVYPLGPQANGRPPGEGGGNPGHRPEDAVPEAAGLRGQGMSIGNKFTLWVVSILLVVCTVTVSLFYVVEVREESSKLDTFG